MHAFLFNAIGQKNIVRKFLEEFCRFQTRTETCLE